MSGFVVKAKRLDGTGPLVEFPQMSKNSDIQVLRKRIAESALQIPVAKQRFPTPPSLAQDPGRRIGVLRLFINGREAKPKDANGFKYTLFDYGIQCGMVRATLPSLPAVLEHRGLWRW